MATDYSDVLDMVVAGVAALAPAGVTVARVAGAFEGAELQRHIMAAPSIIIACLDLSAQPTMSSSVPMMQGRFVAYVLTRGVTRERAGLELVSSLIAVLPGAQWGEEDTLRPVSNASILAHNLYSGELDSIAIALWAVSWLQSICPT